MLCFVSQTAVIDIDERLLLFFVLQSAVIDGTLLSLKYMKKEPGQGTGVIINTSSVGGE